MGNELSGLNVSEGIVTIPNFTRRIGLPLLYAATLLTAAWLSHFAVFRNDVFPLRWQAEHLSIQHPESFYDGFFTIGYPLLIRLSEITGNPVLTVILLQIVLSVLFVVLLQSFFKKTVSAEASIIAFPFVLFFPHLARSILTPTPDFIAALLCLAGFVALVQKASNRRWAIAGILFGSAYLFRTHVLVLIFTLALALLLFQHGQRLRSTVWYVVGAAPFIIFQGLLQLWSGHGFFETSQAFNVWRVMYGMDWNNPPNLAGAGIWSLIGSKPWAFVNGFWIAIRNELWYILPLLAASIFLLMRTRWKKHNELMILLVGVLIYVIITNSGGSPRNIIIVIPVIAMAVIYLIMEATSNIDATKKLQVAHSIAILAWATGIAGMFFFSHLAAHRIEDYSEVEQVLHVQSKHDAHRIYTDDFDFYFPGLKYQSPRKSGGWPEVGLPHYIEMFPHIRDTSAQVLHEDLVHNGIRWAVFRIPPYDGRGYESVKSDSTLFRLTYQTPLHKIYRVE